jgi:radical SAM protein with 4Fe4S-binding SPASM domain
MVDHSDTLRLNDLPLWERIRGRRVPVAFDIELTARCNNNCIHCYINLPAGDQRAKATELTLDEIDRYSSEAVEMGALWCLLSGGEPLLRPDFEEIFRLLKRKGLLVSIFTNATLISREHIALFEELPPREIEVTVYGISEGVYERVTRKPGSYVAFRRGLALLQEAGLRVRLKAIALRSNLEQFDQIMAFCREHSCDPPRYDPLIHLRYDRDPVRNAEIRSERLLVDEVIDLERRDAKRIAALQKSCGEAQEIPAPGEPFVMRCGAGNKHFTIGADGAFRLCSSLWAAGTTYDLRSGTLKEAWNEHVPAVRQMRATNHTYLETCLVCPLTALCYRCAAYADLESGSLDGETGYYCDVAHARMRAFGGGSTADARD